MTGLPLDVPMVRLAHQLAAEHHHGQTDKAGHPYIHHVTAVAAALVDHGPEAVAAGLLHDIVEDTPVTLHDLVACGFPPAVVAAVDSVTRREGETYLDMVRRAAADPLGRLVKLADNAHNSDPARLAVLDARVAGSLRDRYGRARRILLDGARADRG